MICTIIAAVVSCLIDPTVRPTPAQAAAILEQAQGLSNRTKVYVPSTEEQRRPRFVLVPSTTASAAKPVETRESEQARANRLGIPGGWTALEYAILNSGR